MGDDTGYKLSIGLKKGAWVFLAVMVALAAFWQSGEAAQWNWTASMVVAAVTAAAKVGVNFVKKAHPEWIPGWLTGMFPLVLVCAVLASGCLTTARTTYSETLTADGGSTTTYEARATAAPFGKLNEGIFNLDYKWGGENDLAIGQAANGLDNEGQAVALATALKEANDALANLTGIIQQLATAGVLAPRPRDAEVNVQLPSLEGLGLAK